MSLWAKLRRRAPGVEFWDYGLYNQADQCLNVVVVGPDGAGVLPCATTGGDQLRHLGCPVDGPCMETRRST